VDLVEAVGPFDERSIVSALATAVKQESDVVLYASTVHDSEAVASHFLDQRDIAFCYLQSDTGNWRLLARSDSDDAQPLAKQVGSLADLVELLS
jgi:hypothetical protein